MAADSADTALSSALAIEWACLAGPLQGLSHPQDEHLLTVLRYIERNPLRAGLVARAEDWLWSSLRGRGGKETWLQMVPVPEPKDWVKWVNAPMTDTEVEALRHSVNRGAPFGSTA